MNKKLTAGEIGSLQCHLESVRWTIPLAGDKLRKLQLKQEAEVNTQEFH